jgi:hypothetical protein
MWPPSKSRNSSVRCVAPIEVGPKNGPRIGGFPRPVSKDHIIMSLHLTIGPLVSLIAGVLILIIPRLLNYIVAIYLIIIGLIGLFGTGALHV